MKTIFRYLLSLTVIASGIMPRLLVFGSGFFEIAGGLGLLVKQTRRAAAWGLIALFAAVFPANVNMAVHKIYTDNPWILWGRLPFQGVLIAWAYWFTRPDTNNTEADTL